MYICWMDRWLRHGQGLKGRREYKQTQNFLTEKTNWVGRGTSNHDVGTQEGNWVMKKANVFNNSVCELLAEHSWVWVSRELSCKQFYVVVANVES